MDYAGQPCDYAALAAVAAAHDLPLRRRRLSLPRRGVEGAARRRLAALSTFSFHPVKPITTGEGGMVTTNDAELARRMRTFRNHGITTDHRQREQAGSWLYEMVDLGYNYRLTDIQCALGLSQLRKLPDWVKRAGRRSLAATTRRSPTCPGVEPLRTSGPTSRTPITCTSSS